MTAPLVPSVPSDTYWAASGIDDNLGRTLEDLPRWLGRTYKIWENVYAWDARIDGTTDDSDAVQGAINYVHAHGGGVVYIPPGTCRCNVTTYANVWIRGAGISFTILKSVEGSNADVIKGADFDTLTGKAYAAGDYARGAYDAMITDLTVDGDKSHNSAGYGIRIWGKGLKFQNVKARNCKNDGIWTEFTTHDNGNEDNEPGGWFHNIHTTNNGANGWTFRGPHDSQLDNLTTWGNTSGWGLYSARAANSYNGSLGHCKGWNAWLNANSFHFDTAPGSLDAGAATAANTGVGVDLAAGSGDGKFTNMTISGHETGVVLQGTNHMFQGIVQGCTDGVETINAGQCTVLVSATNNDNLFKFTSSLGNNRYDVAANVVGGTLFTGTPATSDHIYPTFIDDSLIAQGWQRHPTLTTDHLDDITEVLEGATLWDSTLHQPVWWDGTTWRHTRSVTDSTIADGVALPDGKGGLGEFANLLLYSEQFDNAAWAKDHSSGTAATVTANTTTPPTGSGSTADTLTNGSVGGTDNVLRQRVAIGSAIGGRTFTFSIYVKASAGTNGKTAIIRMQDTGTDNTGGQVHTEATLLSSGWQRIVTTYTFTAGNAHTDVDVLFYITTGSAVDTYLWGAQLTETDSVAIYTQSVAAAVPATTGLSLTVDKGLFGGGIGVGNSAAATVLGSVVKKVQIFDAAGTSLGYVPVYDAIT